MNLKNKISAPEPSEEELLALERAVLRNAREVQAEPSPSRSWVPALFALGAAVALALVFVSVAPKFSKQDLPDSPVAYSTAAAEELSVDLGDAKIRLAPGTDLEVVQLANGGQQILLGHGEVHCQVEPRGEGEPFEVLAGKLRVKVVGTEFSVSRADEVKVSVVHGVVAVSSQYESIELRAGMVWSGGEEPKAGTLSRGIHKLASASTEGSVSERTTEEPAPTQGASQESKLRDKQGSQDKESSQGKKHNAPREKLEREPPLVPLEKVLAGANPIRPVVRPSYGEEVARLLAVSSDEPAIAVRELRAWAAKETGPAASFALYSRAYLLFFSLGEYRQVQEAAKNYERRFPRGAEAEDMLWLRVRASCELSDGTGCRAAAHTYLRRFPRGVFRKLAQRITSTSDSE